MEKTTMYCSFDELMRSVDSQLRPICTALRDLISMLHPDHVEVIWQNQRITSYGVGLKKMSEHYAYIAPQTKHVNLGFYHGAAATDPDSFLEDAGKRLRHVKVRNLDEAKNTRIKKLIAEAIVEREESLAQ